MTTHETRRARFLFLPAAATRAGVHQPPMSIPARFSCGGEHD
jgi:hypothetical protein